MLIHISADYGQGDLAFAVEQGQLAFAPGSSGWKNGQGRETRWMELFLRGGSAWEAFDRPAVGGTIQKIDNG
jgi:hypothetical protein